MGEYDLNGIGSVKKCFMVNKEFLDAKVFHRVEPIRSELFPKANSVGVELFSKIELMALRSFVLN